MSRYDNQKHVAAVRKALDTKPRWTAETSPLTDDCKMPFGLHEGTKMKDIPVKYMAHMYEKLKADVKIWPMSMADRVREYFKGKLEG